MTTPHDDLYTLELKFPMEVADRLADSHKDGIDAAITQAIKFWLQLGDDTWNIIVTQANTEGMSRAEFVRRAVSKLMQPEDPAILNIRNDMPLAERRALRNADIATRALRGAPRKELAEQYGLSEIRVHQIVASAKKQLAGQKLAQDWQENVE
jgi:hypothetical protein